MPTYVTTIKYREGSGKSRAQMAVELSKLPGSYDQRSERTPSKMLTVVDSLIGGTTIYKEHIQKPDAVLWASCDFLDCTTEISYNQWELVHKQRQESHDRIMDLRARGAAGDVEAAIEYCKIDMDEIGRLFVPCAG